MKVKGVNLGNWLVLEKWMSPALFDGTDAEDEYGLARALPKEVYEARMKIHRSEYISERDFVSIRAMGFDTIRIPVPYFIFGDVEPYIGCIEELDHALNWAERYGLKILIDLHTVPGSQNGFDNGGICGVCTWAQSPEKVEFTLRVLEKLAERYGTREGLFGIEPVNEPVSEEMWKTMNVQERYTPSIPEKAAVSAPVTKTFLKEFYITAYDRLRAYLPEEKAIVLHDGFELDCWKDFMQEKDRYVNVWLDTHQYLMMAEAFGCEQKPEAYVKFIYEQYDTAVTEMEKYFPVVCGEWCLFNSFAVGRDTKGGQTVLNGVENASEESMTDEAKRDVYRLLGDAQLAAWNKGHGYFYWSYKLLTDTVNTAGWVGWDAWDAGRCVDFGWMML